MTKENNAQILIKVTPNFIEKNSMVEFNKYVFSYEVEIKNDSPQSIQLMSRHWIIENSKSEIFEVKGFKLADALHIVRGYLIIVIP